MASYNDIVKKSKTLADVISRSVANKAPRKTGNLQRALKKANNINTMFDAGSATSKNKIVESLTFTYNYAPDDAKYGMWWNEPTLARNIKNAKTKNVPEGINFADKGLNDPKVKAAIDELVDLIGDSVLTTITEELNTIQDKY
jgi:hypothetical protein